jgi:flagellar basal-body rod modification protein FlgD
MAISVDSTTSSSSAAQLVGQSTASSSSGTTIDEAQNRFLSLLVAQMKNQDPLNPLDNAQVTSQLAQISTVNGIEKLNQTLTKLISNSTDGSLMQAANLVGRNVLVDGKQLTLTADGALGGFNLATAADQATITISSSSGQVIRTIQESDLEAGVQNFLWDGLNDAGEAAVAGKYSFSVAATQASKAVTTQALEAVPVLAVIRENGNVMLQTSAKDRVALDAVRQIL